MFGQPHESSQSVSLDALRLLQAILPKARGIRLQLRNLAKATYETEIRVFLRMAEDLGTKGD